MAKTLIGSRRAAWLAVLKTGGVVTTGALITETWYKVLSKGASSALPQDVPVGYPFITHTAITLATGDSVQVINWDRFCKTQCDYSAEQGSIDISTDCAPGATISDGITSLSGSLSGLYQTDDMTGEFIPMQGALLNKFFPGIEDDGSGTGYVFHPVSGDDYYLGVQHNAGGESGTMEEWLLFPLNITSISSSGGNTDAQNLEISWSQGDGIATRYTKPVV
jgi:hypothetical protein